MSGRDGGMFTGVVVIVNVVTQNRSLDEFGSGSSKEAAETDTNDPTEAVEEIDDNSSEEASSEGMVEPIESTYQWTPDGAMCSTCGAAVQRRWRDADGFVCESCKTW